MHLNIREVSRLLKVSEKRVNEWIRRGILRADPVNHQYQLHRSDLLELASSREIDVQAEIFAASEPDRGYAPLLVDALRAGGIFRGAGGADKPTVLRGIVDTLTLPPKVDREGVVQFLLAREAMGSTAIGEGIAIPHVRRPILLSGSAASISLYLLERPVDFGAPDDKPVFAIFLIISPTARTHLQLLSRLSFALHDSELRTALARCAPSAEIVAEFQRVEDAIQRRARKDASQS
jgi:PTS system nitrogen regulatory IIA component